MAVDWGLAAWDWEVAREDGEGEALWLIIGAHGILAKRKARSFKDYHAGPDPAIEPREVVCISDNGTSKQFVTFR